MALSNYPTVINGTYDLYVVPYTGTPETAVPLTLDTIDNSNFLGCTEEGFNLSWTLPQKEIVTECGGETVIDAVKLGVTGCTVSGVFMEWNHASLDGDKRTAVEGTIWPEGSFGELANVGHQVLFSRNMFTMAAVPRTNTPAATVDHVYYFLASYPDMGSDFSANFNYNEQVVPFTFKLFPVPHRDATGTHTIVTPDMDQSQIDGFAANYTMRFFYLDDISV